jgi:hypothetical protein
MAALTEVYHKRTSVMVLSSFPTTFCLSKHGNVLCLFYKIVLYQYLNSSSFFWKVSLSKRVTVPSSEGKET